MLPRGQTQFAVIVDCKGFGPSKTPPLAMLKTAFRAMQKHYPMRLGYVVMVNSGGPVALVWKVSNRFQSKARKGSLYSVNDVLRYRLLHGTRFFVMPLYGIRQSKRFPNALGGVSRTPKYQVSGIFALFVSADAPPPPLFGLTTTAVHGDGYPPPRRNASSINILHAGRFLLLPHLPFFRVADNLCCARRPHQG